MSHSGLTRTQALMSASGQLADRLGIEIVEATPERVVGTMPVEGNAQPFGLLHGGASAALIETIGSIGAVLHAGDGKIAVGVDLNATHVRAARQGLVTGIATAVHLGGSIAAYEVRITDEAGRAICHGRLTCAIRQAPGRGTTPA